MSSSKSLGIDPDRLARIAPYLKSNYIDPGLLPCAQTTVLRRGEVAHFSSLGFADPEGGKPLEADTIFRIYSMTKPVVSVAFMMLVEEGRVALDDPVHRFIPSFRGLEVFDGLDESGAMKTRPTEAPMRMADLLRHTSGLTYDFQEFSPVDAAYREAKVASVHRKYDLEGFVEAISKIPLVASPGEVWNYSVSTDVLGYLVQKISGRPLEDFLKQRIFDPLGMVDTGFQVPAEQAHRLAACYRLAPGATEKSLQDDPADSPYLAPPSYCSGGGGLVSTTADYLKFVRMLLARGQLDGVRLIGPKTLDLMTVNHIPGGRDLTQASISLFSEAAYSGVGFGLGFAVTMDQPKTLIPGSNGDFFWGGMASTFFWVDPAEDLACVFMTQLMPSNTYPVRRQLRTLVYASLTETAT
jgi:CubicO group peptidase (beta-lactamase class C family)